MNIKNVLSIGLVILVLAAIIGCEGEKGPVGPSGEMEIPSEYTNADPYLGGASYSQWYSTDAGGSGSLTISAGSDFARCKACHGWDGLGNAASYSNRTGQSSGKSSRPDVSSIDLRSTIAISTVTELYTLIEHSWGRPLDATANGMPSYKPYLTAGQIWNLVKFMKEEWVEPAELYELVLSGPPITDADNMPTLTFSNIGNSGNSANGNALIATHCVSCHGTDGKLITDVDGKTGIGQFLRQKPHEAWFKIKFGNGGTMEPGELVNSTSDLKDVYKALTDTAAYPD
ncbi:c-type cytochrome [Candidatus Latescibacterota bacterium]